MVLWRSILTVSNCFNHHIIYLNTIEESVSSHCHHAAKESQQAAREIEAGCQAESAFWMLA
jgi:hypothetical protein